MIVTNQIMRDYLEHIKDSSCSQDFHIKELGQIIYSNGLYLLDIENEEYNDIFIKDGDRIGFEADWNHIHIDDYVLKTKNPMDYLYIGLQLIQSWQIILKTTFPNKRFVLILSFDGEYAVVRFYKRRQNEEEWIDFENIEGYVDGVYVIVT